MEIDERLNSLAPTDHVVQCYESEDDALARNVTRYLAIGAGRREALLVVASADHRAAFDRELRTLDVDVDELTNEGLYTAFDAEEMLRRFMVEGHPDALRFETSVGAAARSARARSHSGLRAYGEMVGVLWKNRQFPAAIRLEQLWHKLIDVHTFMLFCGYPIDIFGAEFQIGTVDALLSAHTHLLPSKPDALLDEALERAMTEVLAERRQRKDIDTVTAFYGRRRAAMPNAESTILWLRHSLPQHAEEVLAAAKRHYRVLAVGS